MVTNTRTLLIGIASIIITVYTAFLTPSPPPFITELFKNPVFKVFMIFLVLIIRNVSPVLAIITGIGFILTLQTLHRLNIFSYMNQYLFNKNKVTGVTHLDDGNAVSKFEEELDRLMNEPQNYSDSTDMNTLMEKVYTPQDYTEAFDCPSLLEIAENEPSCPANNALPNCPANNAPSNCPVPNEQANNAPANCPVPNAPANCPAPNAPANCPVPNAPTNCPVPNAPANCPVPNAPANCPTPNAPSNCPVPNSQVNNAPAGCPAPNAPAGCPANENAANEPKCEPFSVCSLDDNINVNIQHYYGKRKCSTTLPLHYLPNDPALPCGDMNDLAVSADRNPGCYSGPQGLNHPVGYPGVKLGEGIRESFNDGRGCYNICNRPSSTRNEGKNEYPMGYYRCDESLPPGINNQYTVGQNNGMSAQGFFNPHLPNGDSSTDNQFVSGFPGNILGHDVASA